MLVAEAAAVSDAAVLTGLGPAATAAPASNMAAAPNARYFAYFPIIVISPRFASNVASGATLGGLRTGNTFEPCNEAVSRMQSIENLEGALREQPLKTFAQIAGHGGQRQALTDIGRRQLDNEPLIGGHGERVGGRDFSGEHVPVVRNQHEPAQVLARSQRIAVDIALAATAFGGTALHTQRGDDDAALARRAQRFGKGRSFGRLDGDQQGVARGVDIRVRLLDELLITSQIEYRGNVRRLCQCREVVAHRGERAPVRLFQTLY